MNRIRKFAACVVLSMALLAPPSAAVADEIETVLKFLADAKIINPKIVDASALIRCFAEHSPEQCVDLQQVGDALASDATSAAEKKAAEFVPDDPMVKTAVDIVRATLNEDWLRVLELTGVKMLGQIACSAGLAVTGPLEPFICGEFANKVLAKTEPVVHEILVVVSDFPNVNVWKMVTVFGFELACDILEGESVPLASEACGVLGVAVKAIADISEAALDAIGAGAEAVVDFLSGSSDGPKTLPPEWWYAHMVRPLMYQRVNERLAKGVTDFGMNNAEMKECMDHYGPYIKGHPCPVFNDRLKSEAEALYTYVLTIPETYFDGWLTAKVRDRVRYRYHSNDAEVYRGYIQALSPQLRTDLVRGYNPILKNLPSGAVTDYQMYFLPRYQDCLSEVNKLFDVGSNWSWDIENWVCFEAVGKRLSAALVAEKSRVSKSTIPRAKAFGCKSTEIGGSQELMFNCQSYAAMGACLNLAREEYEGNLFCTIDKPQAGLRLGMELVGSLTAERCVYIDKDKSGASKPRVACSRPWKRDTCEALLQSYRVRWGLESLSIRMQCEYYPDKDYLDQEARAKQIVAVLNGGSTVELSPDTGRRSLPPSYDSTRCKTLWDPLAINCPHQTQMPPLTSDLATPAIESCPPDPNKNGSNQVCYQTVFTAADSNKEIYENQTLSPVKVAPLNLPPPAAGPVRTANPSRQPEPRQRTAPVPAATAIRLPETSPAATDRPTLAQREPATRPAPASANQAVALPSGSDAAPARTAAPAIRAMNAQQANTEAPPNPCRMSVNYYIPEAPVLTTSGAALQVNDQLQIQCAFRKVTRKVEWPQCDDSARIAMQVLKGAQEAGGRYSGIVSIDDNSVGVASSPEDGGNFQNIKLWKFDEPGAHEVSCQIDNAFRFAMEGEETYLKAAISVDVSARSDGLTYRRFEPANVVPIRVRPTPSEAIPRLQGLIMESATPAARQPGGNDIVNPALNPQPEVPPPRQDDTANTVDPESELLPVIVVPKPIEN